MSKIAPHFLNDSAEVIALTHEIMIEIKSRTIYNDCDNLVIQELINETFVLAENLRTILKKNTHSATAIALETYNVRQMIEVRERLNSIILSLLKDLIVFQSKWSFSFNSWASSFKGQRTNKDVLIRGDEHTHFDFQIQFPNIDRLTNAINILQKRISTVADLELPSIIDETTENLKANSSFKTFMYKLFGKNPNTKYTFFNKEK